MTKVSGPGDSRFASKAVTRKLTNYSTALTKGDITVIDRSVVDATTLEFDTCKAVAGADVEYGIVVVALEDIAASAVGHFGLKGRFECHTDGTIALDAVLSATVSAVHLTASSATDKIVAYPLEGGTDAVLLCEFDGINGFGYDHA